MSLNSSGLLIALGCATLAAQPRGVRIDAPGIRLQMDGRMHTSLGDLAPLSPSETVTVNGRALKISLFASTAAAQCPIPSALAASTPVKAMGYGRLAYFGDHVELSDGRQDFASRPSDYVNGVDLGTVSGPVASVTANFSQHLLLEAAPE